jgi:hypothetical protein
MDNFRCFRGKKYPAPELCREVMQKAGLFSEEGEDEANLP